ncbi:MAG: PrsW family intramembrane metalloprotease [Microbacterium sp.]
MTFGGQPHQAQHSPQPGYPQGAYHSSLAQAHRGQGAPIAAARPQQHLALPPVPSRVHPLWFLGWIGIGLLAFWVLLTFVLPMLEAGIVPFFVAAVIALVPFTIVIMTVMWIDNWEPEPKGLIVFALAWGAIAAIGLTTLFLMFSDWFALSVLRMDPETHEVLATILRAPIVEELFKMLGVFVIMLLAKHTIDGPIDGLVYGSLIGAGFAFTENIQYFILYGVQQGLGETVGIFFTRGILSPFAHAMFTGIFGMLVGLALRNRRSVALYAFVGYVVGVAMHALWNASGFVSFLLLYIVLQVPQFVLFIIAIVYLRKEKATITHQRLSDYVRAGWFTPQEIDMLATPKGRRVGKQWASGLPGNRSGLMKTFIRDATQLAMARERGLSGRDPRASEAETQLLHRVLATRQALLSP